MDFTTALKNWFYNNGTSASLENGTRVCLLDSVGDPIGSSPLARIKGMFLDSDEYVDMGLPSGKLWAKKNLGADSTSAYGVRVSWGNTDIHEIGGNYVFSQANYQNTKGYTISGSVLPASSDAARVILGSTWRLPTNSDYYELLLSENTTKSWTTQDGVNGLLLTSKNNGNTLFFPACGSQDDSTSTVGTNGYYWTRESNQTHPSQAYAFYFTSSTRYTNEFYRTKGCCIRPVIY